MTKADLIKEVSERINAIEATKGPAGHLTADELETAKTDISEFLDDLISEDEDDADDDDEGEKE
jgi:hypothetical protein